MVRARGKEVRALRAQVHAKEKCMRTASRCPPMIETVSAQKENVPLVELKSAREALVTRSRFGIVGITSVRLRHIGPHVIGKVRLNAIGSLAEEEFLL